MAGKVCHFQKFGYCKFQDRCKRKHLTEVCGSLSRCKDIKQCKKKYIQRTANNSLQEMVADMEKTVPIPTVLINMLKSGMS